MWESESVVGLRSRALSRRWWNDKRNSDWIVKPLRTFDFPKLAFQKKLINLPSFPICPRSYICGVLLDGGTETTASFLQNFVLCIVKSPAILRKAQKEVDSVVGERMPVPNDIESMPYVQAVIKEVWCAFHCYPIPFNDSTAINRLIACFPLRLQLFRTHQSMTAKWVLKSMLLCC